MGLNEFRNEVQPQLVQLMSQVAAYPGFPEPPYRAHLVSNGYFDEEVQRAVDDLNRMPSYPNKVSLVSRGDLLDWCNRYGVPLWPGELKDSRSLLEIFLWDSKDVFPTTKLSQLIDKILALEPAQANLSSYPEYCRAVSSSALLTGIAVSGFAEAQNHYAVASAWTLFAVSIIAAADKQRYNLDGTAAETLRLAESAAIDALSQLWNEVMERKFLVEGDAFSDPEVYGWRYTTLLGLLSCLALYDDTFSCLTEESRTRLEQWLTQRHSNVDLWGEAAVANLVPWFVWLRKHDATPRVDFEIEGLVRAVITRNQGKSPIPLASPYYSYEKIARSRLHLQEDSESSLINQETFAGSSFTAEPLFHMLVRTNLKQTCKRLWPDFTKLLHRACVPDDPWEYCTLAIRSGADDTKLYPPTYNWADLSKEAIQLRSGFIPAALAARPYLVALWWQVAPYRYTSESSKIFVEGVFPGWGRWGF
jgi:hypothetical protein